MPALTPELRNKLERAIIDARNIAEAGAQAALEAMAVHHHDFYPHQTPEQRKLRNHLRAHARQLGDQQDSKGKLHIAHLIHECAYEHWHRMLFARFLAENDLLIEPSSGVAISLQECEELAKKAETDLWTFASRCAQQMLPQIFRPEDPLLQVTLAREHRGKLEALLNGLPQAVFKADDALGWVYQFWQSKKKEEVNASGEKITGDTLPAVTQLFTEHYMVLFLLHNTIGAWHAGKVLATNPKLAESAASEDELRRAVAIKAAGGYSFDYLRFVRGQDGTGGPWRPAAGTFDGWPKRASELKVLDPCCGSGHFLVAVFEMLLRLRMDAEGLSLKDAVDAVLRDNIFGLELDARCTQIAAFNLALAAWKHGEWRKLPSPNIACSGFCVNAKKETWVKLSKGDESLVFPLGQLWELFQKAPVLGSLINPSLLPRVLIGNAPDFSDLRPILDKALALEAEVDDDAAEMIVAAQGVARAAEILAGHFTLVITNVPYLGRGKQDAPLKEYCERIHPKAQADLATCFVERCLDFCLANGTAALVTPQNWLFLGTYKKLRATLLQGSEWNVVARLGARAFETITGEVVNVTLLALTRAVAHPAMSFLGIDASDAENPPEKARRISQGPLSAVSQQAQLQNPDATISFVETADASFLARFAYCYQGTSTGDNPRLTRCFWELPSVHTGDWEFFQMPPGTGSSYAGKESVVNWTKLNAGFDGAAIRGAEAWGKAGIAFGQMTDLPATLFQGTKFSNSCPVLVPLEPDHLLPIWTFCSSGALTTALRHFNQKLSVDNGYITKVPFDLAYWQRVAAQRFPSGLPEPISDDLTQWIFNGNPKGAADSLQVAIARLLGYRWPRQTESSFPACPALKSDGLDRLASPKGIICIPSVRGENPAADRLGALLAACEIKPDRDLDDWLRSSFFEEHCKVFHHRPFIWHVWDGRARDGFHALVNYHKLAEGNGKGRKLLESLTYSYLGEWIKRQQDGVKRGEGGAEDRLAAATELQKRLEAILKGEPPFDIFVRWKPLQQQPIGWEPDINDGVRLNIRPFLADDLPNGRTGAGVLRWKPNIKWDKDRGKEPHRPKTEFPWFWNWDEESEDFLGGKSFTGERFNVCHYTTAVKQKVRESAEKVGSKR